MESRKFLNPTIVVDITLFTIESGELKVLLIKRENDPFKNLEALPGGYLLEGETTQDAAERILFEKAGIKNIYMEQLYTFDSLDRDPRGPVFSVTYIALVPISKITIVNKEKNSQVSRFCSSKKIPKLAFDHKKIIRYGVDRIQGKLEYTTIGFNMLPELFTLSQAQEVYETILNKTIDKRNFRKKILELNFIKETKHMQSGLRQRPAKLYMLNTKSNTIKSF